MIVKKSNDKNYPFTIEGGWGDKVYCTVEDLKEIRKAIDEIFLQEKQFKNHKRVKSQ